MSPEDRIAIIGLVARIRADLKILEDLLLGADDIADSHLRPGGDSRGKRK